VYSAPSARVFRARYRFLGTRVVDGPSTHWTAAAQAADRAPAAPEYGPALATGAGRPRPLPSESPL